MTGENTNKITDRAWERLHTRLEKDGLLPDSNTASTTKKQRLAPIKLVAGVAVLCICIAIAYMLGNNTNAEQIDLLTLSNEETTSTLISTLEDGSIVYLSRSAKLQYPTHFKEDKREVYLEGGAYFDISKKEGKPFIIDTKQAVIEVLGTAFNVKSDDNNSFSLSVHHGKVKVVSKITWQTVYVDGGETALFDADNLYKMPTSNPEQFAAYLKKVHFKDERLADIIKVINMNGDSVLLQIAPQIENRLLTVSFSDNTPLSIAELICMAMNLKYTQTNDVILIHAPN